MTESYRAQYTRCESAVRITKFRLENMHSTVRPTAFSQVDYHGGNRVKSGRHIRLQLLLLIANILVSHEMTLKVA